jgi:hypothetical protein
LLKLNKDLVKKPRAKLQALYLFSSYQKQENVFLYKKPPYYPFMFFGLLCGGTKKTGHDTSKHSSDQIYTSLFLFFP